MAKAKPKTATHLDFSPYYAILHCQRQRNGNSNRNRTCRVNGFVTNGVIPIPIGMVTAFHDAIMWIPTIPLCLVGLHQCLETGGMMMVTNYSLRSSQSHPLKANINKSWYLYKVEFYIKGFLPVCQWPNKPWWHNSKHHLQTNPFTFYFSIFSLINPFWVV